MWPDLAIFESSRGQIFELKKILYVVTFGLFTKNHLLSKNSYDYFLGNYWNTLGYF